MGNKTCFPAFSRIEGQSKVFKTHEPNTNPRMYTHIHERTYARTYIHTHIHIRTHSHTIMLIPEPCPCTMVMGAMEPWSKKHKLDFRACHGGMPYSLSNSFAQPLSHAELLELSLARGDHKLVGTRTSTRKQKSTNTYVLSRQIIRFGCKRMYTHMCI